MSKTALPPENLAHEEEVPAQAAAIELDNKRREEQEKKRDAEDGSWEEESEPEEEEKELKKMEAEVVEEGVSDDDTRTKTPVKRPRQRRWRTDPKDYKWQKSSKALYADTDD